MKIFGLTGGIGSGKTTVAQIFKSLGVPVIDADQVSRELRQPGKTAHAWIVNRFGTDDPVQLRRIIFKDPMAKKELEKYLHPLIKKESEDQFLSHRGKAPYVIYEAALLVEAGRHLDFDGLIVVTSDAELQLKRIIDRDQMNEQLARQMIDSQIASNEREKLATHIIKNHGDLEDLKIQVKTLDAHLRS